MVETIGHPLLFLLVVNLLLLVVGCFMEALAAMLILIPILTPAAAQLGIDPVQFGLVFVLNLMIGTVTPPVGVVLFVTSRIAGHLLRGDVAGDPALAPAAPRRSRRHHALATPDDLPAEAPDGPMRPDGALCRRPMIVVVFAALRPKLELATFPFAAHGQPSPCRMRYFPATENQLRSRPDQGSSV